MELAVISSFKTLNLLSGLIKKNNQIGQSVHHGLVFQGNYQDIFIYAHIYLYLCTYLCVHIHIHIYTHTVLLWRGGHMFPCAWAPNFIMSSVQNTTSAVLAPFCSHPLSLFWVLNELSACWYELTAPRGIT